MPASFKFIKYKIVKLDYRADDAKEKSSGSRNVDLKARLDRNNDDQSIFRLLIDVHVTGNPSVDLIIHGFYQWTGDYISGKTEYCLHTSGASVLYPYARAAISTASVLDGSDPIILQTINFYDLVQPINAE